MITSFRGVHPSIEPTAYLTASAVVIGDVVIGPESSLWFNTVVRGDVGPIRIGARTNLQDGVTLHVVGGK
ncbi:MAG: gamma carbonic anhydrase family protein, partial [Candidatus Binatia bacterium]